MSHLLRRRIYVPHAAIYVAGGAPPAFDITALSDIVAVYDAAQGTYVERTGGGSTPSSVDGVVGTWRNLVSGGSAYHGVAPSDSARGILRNGSGKAWIEFDGVDDRYLTAWPEAEYAVVAAVRIASGQSGYKGIMCTDFTTNGIALYGVLNGGNWGVYGAAGVGGTGNYPANTNAKDDADHTLILEGLSSGTFYFDGASDGTFDAHQGSAGDPSALGSSGPSQCCAMRLYGFAIRSTAWGSDLANVHAWAASLMP